LSGLPELPSRKQLCKETFSKRRKIYACEEKPEYREPLKPLKKGKSEPLKKGDFCETHVAYRLALIHAIAF